MQEQSFLTQIVPFPAIINHFQSNKELYVSCRFLGRHGKIAITKELYLKCDAQKKKKKTQYGLSQNTAKDEF